MYRLYVPVSQKKKMILVSMPWNIKWAHNHAAYTIVLSARGNSTANMKYDINNSCCVRELNWWNVGRSYENSKEIKEYSYAKKKNYFYDYLNDEYSLFHEQTICIYIYSLYFWLPNVPLEY